MSQADTRILYCRCQYAQVVPEATKDAVLASLCDSGTAFDAVADLCEMAARRDPLLPVLAACGALKIAACYPRAVKGLFHQAAADLAQGTVEVLNMRTQTPEEIGERLFSPDLRPNLPGATADQAGPV